MITESQNTEFRIPQYHMAGVRARIAKINKRAGKLGVDGVQLIELGIEQKKEVKPDTLIPDAYYETGKVLIFHKIRLSVSEIKIAGYQFVATIQHTEAGNIIRQSPSFTGEVPEKFRTVETHCEHCQMKRKRKDTFLVFNGDFKQVGRSCMRDFLGHDVTNMIARYEWLQGLVGSLGEWEEEGRTGRRGGGEDWSGLGMQDYLEVSAAFVRKHGWKPASFEQGSTAELSFNSFMSSKAEKAKPEDEDKQLVGKALEWLETADAKSQYIANLQVAVKLGFVTGRTYRMVSSLIGTYLKAVEQLERREKEKNRVKSKFVGAVGDKLELEVVYKGSKTFDGQWGESYLYMFEDLAGNLIRWFSSKYIEVSKGDLVCIRGRVKKQDVYREDEQTFLTRCTIKPVENKA